MVEYPQQREPLAMKIDPEVLARTSSQLETATPGQILQWGMETFGPKLTMATAFGAEGCALIAMIAGIRDATGLTVDIFNLDTGYQFPQTLALRERILQKYGIEVRFVRASETVSDMEARFGGPIYKTDSDQCCHIRKIVPMEDAVKGFDAWITAIRREQTPERANQPIVGSDAKFDLVKINPLANWTKQQVWDYIHENGVPTNPLHEQGFPSIGCWPCTRPVQAGEDERSGRWAGSAKRECGLHLNGGQLSRAAS
jgi:phosphoadenosine phosphosulfate reductase